MVPNHCKCFFFVFQKLKSLTPKFSSDVETSSKRAEIGLLSGFDTNDFGSKNVETGLKTKGSKADVGKAFSLETATVESLIPADTPAAKDKFMAADTLEQHETPKHETLVSDPSTKSLLAAAALESTRLIPVRPTTPFAATSSVEIIEGGDEDLCLSKAPHKDTVSVRK